jgi:hypothetical protein
VKPTGEEAVFLLQSSLLDPRLQRIPGGLGDLELNWALGLVLHDDGARRHLVAMAHVPYPEGDEIAATQFAVDPQVEEGEFTDPPLHLESHAKCQISLSLNGAFCPTILPLFHGSR